MVNCAAFGCSNRREHKLPGLTFHSFPVNKELRKKWEIALRRENFKATKHTMICSVHFKEDDFDRTSPFLTKLKTGVVPSVFPGFPEKFRKEKVTAAKHTKVPPLENENQIVRCFICDEVVDDVKNSILMDTTLNIPDKLGQIVGEEYTVIVSEEDYLCKVCCKLIRQMDELQRYLNNIISTLSSHLNKKYGLTSDNNGQEVNGRQNIKEEDFELHECTMCSFSSVNKDVFDNHIRAHVLNNMKTNNYVGAQNSNLHQCGICFKTYHIKEEYIEHMNIFHKLDSASDKVEAKPEATSVEESKEEEDRLYSCNNCFLTFVDEYFLAEHDCCQDSDQEISDSCLKDSESQTQQSQQVCNVGVVEQIDLVKNVHESENVNSVEVDSLSNLEVKLNTVPEESQLIDFHLKVDPKLDSFESQSGKVNVRSLDKNETLPCINSGEVITSADQLNGNYTENHENSTNDIVDKIIDSELFLFENTDGNVVIEDKETEYCDKEENPKVADQNDGKSDPVKRKVFVCGKCKFKTDSQLDLKAHFLVHLEHNTTSKPNRTCSICNISFERVARFQIHMRGHDNSVGPLNCSYCGVQVHDKLHLRSHNLQNHALLINKKPICDICNEVFPTFKILKKHKNVDHLDNFIYKCNMCEKTFKQKIQLKNHLDYAHRSSPKCKFCDKIIENLKKLREHEYRHMRFDSKKFQCDLCSRVFKTHSGLRFHKLRHTGKYPFFCEVCGHGFVSIKMLEEHKGVHTKEDRYMCDICGRMFCFYSSYMIHRKWHDNPFPYKCNICNQKFHHTSVLAVHKRRVHTKERPYKCPFCVLSFVVSSTYKKHLCLHTQEFPYNCNNCNRGFTTRKKYATHLAKTHNDYSLLNEGPKKCEYKMSLRNDN